MSSRFLSVLATPLVFSTGSISVSYYSLTSTGLSFSTTVSLSSSVTSFSSGLVYLISVFSLITVALLLSSISPSAVSEDDSSPGTIGLTTTSPVPPSTTPPVSDSVS